MARTRYEITGTWSGPQNPAGDYIRLCHREYTTRSKFAEWCQTNKRITFSDGTSLIFNVRTMDNGERAKKPMDYYGSLIHSCYLHDVNSVDELTEAEKAAKNK